jgi:hypothetical protein
MDLAEVLAIGLGALGLWGAYTTFDLVRVSRPWSASRWYAVGTDAVFTTSCLLGALALHGQWFAPSMLLPIGASYAAMIPIPCYFSVVNRIAWLHALRNLLFVLLSLCFLAFGFGLLPLSLLGL